MDIKKEIKTRLRHPSTLVGLGLIASAVLHFFGIVSIGAQKEYVTEVSGLLATLGLGGVISKGWGKL